MACIGSVRPWRRAACRPFCASRRPILSTLDWYVDYRLLLWLRCKHKRVPKRKLSELWCQVSRAHPGARVWAEGSVEQHRMAYVPVRRYELKWMKSPDFAKAFGEPDA